MSEAELINRCIQKDPLAWNEFVERYSRLIYWSIENRLKKWDYIYQPQDVEEIHQNVFLNLWRKNKLEQIKDLKKITCWLVIVSANEAVDYFKYQKGQNPPHAISIFEEIIKKNRVLTIADILPSRNQGPSYELQLKETEGIIEQEIGGLPYKDQIIIKLHFLYDKKYREIAEILNMPVGSVSTAIKNIRKTLKQRLKGKI